MQILDKSIKGLSTNMKTQPILIIFLFSVLFTYAQNDAFTTEVTTRNGLIYYKGQPLSGVLYQFNDNAKTSCHCTMKTLITNGRPDGISEEWYVTGKRKYKGLFDRGQKEGRHQYWSPTGVLEKEEEYNHDRLIKQINYYPSGQKKDFKEYTLDNSIPVLITDITYSDNALTPILREARYQNSKLISEIVYENGKLASQKKKKGNTLYLEEYQNGNVFISGYFNTANQKDSLWLTYNNDGTKKAQESYRDGTLTQRGIFVDEEKSGTWNYYLSDGKTQKNITYVNGEEIDIQKFTKDQLITNALNENNISLLKFDPTSGEAEYIIFKWDDSHQISPDHFKILYAIKEQLLSRLHQIPKKDYGNMLWDKRLVISNINIKYKKSLYEKRTGGTENGYDSFIGFDMELTDRGGKTLENKSFKVNKSDKLLNSFFNSLASTYARSESEAFKRSLSEIDLSEFLATHFTISSDLGTKKKK